MMFKLRIYLLILCIGIGSVGGARADSPVKVDAVVESNNVGLNEVFEFQIQIQSDSNAIKTPDMSGVADFTYSYQGASQSSNSYISVVNGSQKRVTITRYTLSYQMHAKSAGKYVIPELGVEVNGTMYHTKPITINVTEDNEQRIASILEYKLPRNTVYLGETVPLELVWYFRNNPKNINFDVPEFTDDRFIISKASPPAKEQDGERLVEVYFNGAKYWAVQSEAIIDGVAYASVRIKWYVAPKEVGHIDLLPSSVEGALIVGYKEGQRFAGMPQGFSSFFDNDAFFSGREPIVKRFVTATKPLSIEVLPLPLKGKPVNFSGVISPIKLGVKTSTESAAVGEPINVELYVGGNDNIYNIKLPDFNEQDGIKGNFKVTEDSTGGSIVGNMRLFNLTFRALTPKVTAIPALEISYFDPDSNEYKVAKSWNVPIAISAAKIITATDIESSEPGSAAKEKVEENQDGIYANVLDEEVLVNKNIPVWKYLSDNKVFFTVFPGCYFSLILGQLVMKRRGDGAGKRAANRAIRDFSSNLQRLAKREVTAQDLTDCLSSYFRVRLQLGEIAFTLSDIVVKLQECGCIDQAVIDNFAKITDYCEACCYTGQQGQSLSRAFVDTTLQVMVLVDNELNEM